MWRQRGGCGGGAVYTWPENWSDGADFSPSQGLAGGAWAALRSGLAGLGGPGLQLELPTRTVVAAAMGIGAGTWSAIGALFGEHYPAALRATAAALC